MKEKEAENQRFIDELQKRINSKMSEDDIIHNELTLIDVDKLNISPSLDMEQYIQLANDFRKSYLKLKDNDEKDTLLDFTVVSLRVLIKIVSDLRRTTFKSRNINLNELTPEEIENLSYEDKRNIHNKIAFEDFKDNQNIYLPFKYRVKDFVPNRSVKRLEEGLIFLKQYKEQTYYINRSNNRKLRTYGGLLSHFIIDENTGYFYVMVNTFWVDKIVDLTNNYSILFTEHLSALNDIKKILFYTMIMSMPDNGLRIRKDWFNEYFDFNYRNFYDIKRSFIDKVKEVCDTPIVGAEKEQRSFYYFDDAENDKYVRFMPMLLKPNKAIANIKTFDNNNFKYKIAYYKKRHQLSIEQATFLRERLKPTKQDDFYIENPYYPIFNEAYKSFIKQCKQDNIIITDVVGNDFIEAMKKELENIGQVFILI